MAYAECWFSKPLYAYMLKEVKYNPLDENEVINICEYKCTEFETKFRKWDSEKIFEYSVNPGLQRVELSSNEEQIWY